MTFICRSQNIISGDINVCPDIPYYYSFNGSASSGTVNFTVEGGRVVSRGERSIIIEWYNNVIYSGRWKISVNYYDPQLNKTMQTGLIIMVKATTSFTLSGEKEIEYGFRGTKTYTASPTSAGYPASSYNWQTNSGINITTSEPTVNITFPDDNLNYIVVRGKNSNCESWGPQAVLNIKRLIKITGPSTVCSVNDYNFSYPGSVTLLNADNIATLTKISDNKYRVSRIGTSSGIVTLRATSPTDPNSFTEMKIAVGGLVQGRISGSGNMYPGSSGNFTLILDDPSKYNNIKFLNPGGTTMTNINSISIKLTIKNDFLFAPGETQYTIFLRCQMDIIGCGPAEISVPILVFQKNPPKP